MVFVFAEFPVQCSELGCAFDTPGCSLVDVDVGDTVLGVLFYVEGDGCETDGFAGDPANALEGEDGFGVIGEGFVLG